SRPVEYTVRARAEQGTPLAPIDSRWRPADDPCPEVSRMKTLRVLLLGGLLACIGIAEAQTCRAPAVVVDTVLGMKYCADPAFSSIVDTWVQRLRQDARTARQAGRLVIYMSTPISPRGGGVEKVNVEIAAAVKTRLQKAYGTAVWILDPGVYQMPSVATKSPGGGDYMVMFTRVL